MDKLDNSGDSAYYGCYKAWYAYPESQHLYLPLGQMIKFDYFKLMLNGTHLTLAGDANYSHPKEQLVFS